MSVTIERRGAVTTVVIDRPQVRNAIDRATAGALAQAFREFDADPEARVAVLLRRRRPFLRRRRPQGLRRRSAATVVAPRTAPGTTGPDPHAAVQAGDRRCLEGYAVAGGLELALMVRPARGRASATFGVFCRRWGVPLIDGGTVRLSRLIGQGRALDLILTGRAVGADEALAMGLANRVVDDGRSARRGASAGAQIAAFPAAPACARPAVELRAMGPAAGPRR
jgi:enoyl-CoA hydratase